MKVVVAALALVTHGHAEPAGKPRADRQRALGVRHTGASSRFRPPGILRGWEITVTPPPTPCALSRADHPCEREGLLPTIHCADPGDLSPLSACRFAVTAPQLLAGKEGINTINTRLDGIDSRLDNLDARVGRIEADVHALRDEMVRRQEYEDIFDRVKYIEKKLGIDSGV
jgi:hypothetical protein